MKKIFFLVILLSSSIGFAQNKRKPNIINYFASNNQVVGVPMVDMPNLFRFYPDLNFQQAITGIEVYYFVLNDVYKHHLVKRDDGRYWEATIRDFSLGESIQRVEVIVDCSIAGLNRTLSTYGLKSQGITDLTPYLLLRRGDDKSLVKFTTFENLKAQGKAEYKALTTIIGSMDRKINDANNKVAAINDALKLVSTSQDSIDKKLTSLNQTNNQLLNNYNRLNKKYELSGRAISGDDIKDLKLATDTIMVKLKKENAYVAKANQEAVNSAKQEAHTLDTVFENLNVYLESETLKINERVASYQAIQNKIEPLNLQVGQSHADKEHELLKEISSNPDNRLYSAYVENRVASMLDMRYKDTDTTVIQFNYRNDKQSLQYLQADDPQEKLSIFRARLVPFAFYRQLKTEGTPPVTSETEFQWQRGKIIYEIGINFGYAIVKGDHFMPKFFDMNRLGLGVGITADTFSDHPSFLSVSLTYDMNTYTSISFGANLVDKPGFYLGVGINARAFKDLVKSSATLFR